MGSTNNIKARIDEYTNLGITLTIEVSNHIYNHTRVLDFIQEEIGIIMKDGVFVSNLTKLTNRVNDACTQCNNLVEAQI